MQHFLKTPHFSRGERRTATSRISRATIVGGSLMSWYRGLKIPRWTLASVEGEEGTDFSKTKGLISVAFATHRGWCSFFLGKHRA